MARARAKAKFAAEVTRAWIKLFEEAFFNLMMAMVKAEPYEEDYAQFEDATRKLTKEQLRRISRYAAEHFVSTANPNFGKLDRSENRRIQISSIEHALHRLADE
jgi:hypothetical protein